MVFDITDKVALITGGVSGIGACLAKELLRHGVKAVSLIDVNEEAGESFLTELEEEFGQDKAIFIKANIVDISEFESAFEKTIETYNQLDIVVNSAGIFNDKIYPKCIEVNVTGTLHGNYLAIEKYLPKYKSSEDAVVVNMSSMAGVRPYPAFPAYTTSKFAVHGLSLAFGNHYKRTNVRVLGICPGLTETPMARDLGKQENYYEQSSEYFEKIACILPCVNLQSPEFCASKIVDIIKLADSGTMWIINNDDPYQFVLPDLESMEKKYLQ